MVGVLDVLPSSLRLDLQLAPLWREVVSALDKDGLQQPIRFISDHQHHLLIEGLLLVAILYLLTRRRAPARPTLRATSSGRW